MPTASSADAAVGRRAARRWKDAGSRLLAIAGLCALAVAQPVLDLLGNNPATFRINRIDGTDIVWFAVGIVAVPPLTLWVVGEAAFAVHRRVGRLVHVATVAALTGFFVVLLAKSATDSVAIHTVVGLLGAGAGAFAYQRYEVAASWSRLVSAANPVLLGLFVFAAPVSDSIHGGTQEIIEVAPPAVAEVGAATEEPPTWPSVVMLVFDEWPTQSILTADETVDDQRFPNLAAFAEESTWYRRFTTASAFTATAVPTLIDGLDPQGEPVWQDHPESLFSLLGGTHHMIVSESFSELCGLEGCGLRPVPPPPPVRPDSQLAPPPPPAAPPIDTTPRWGRLLDTALDVWTARITPGEGDAAESFDDFEEEFLPVEPEPPSVPPAAPSSTSTTAPDPVEALDDDALLLEQFLATQVGGQPSRHRLFVDALQPTDVPFFAFFHVLLPHQPWTLREDGTPYRVAEGRENFADDNDHPWPVAVTRQRHLLQAEYTDRLLGDVLRRLREIGEYDDSIVVVVSDHGVAFEPGESNRRVSETNLEQITYAPLFIKAPGQAHGRIDDANLNSTDVAPTIAAHLGLELPWDTVGAPAGSAEIEARGANKYVYSFTDDFEYEFLGVVEYDDRTAYADLLAGRPAPIPADGDRLAPLYHDVPGAELIGTDADAVLGPLSGTASVVGSDLLVRPDPDHLPGEIAGRVADAPDDATVLVAVNGQIVAVSPLYPRGDDDGHFVVLLPAGALEAQNSVRLGLRLSDGSIGELALE